MKRAAFAAALLLLPTLARAEVDVVKIPKGAGGVGFLPLVVMEEKKLVEQEAQKMGLKTRVSTNPAMTLGGLKEGVPPLEMAYAYSTIANYGKRVSGTFASSPMGPL